MSLCIAALTPSGIILTADSRQTYRNNAGMTRIGTDNAVKLFRLAAKAGVVIAGRAFFPDSAGVMKNAGWFIEEFAKKEQTNIVGMAVKDIGQKLTDYFVREFIDPEEKRLHAHIGNLVAAEG